MTNLQHLWHILSTVSHERQISYILLYFNKTIAELFVRILLDVI